MARPARVSPDRILAAAARRVRRPRLRRRPRRPHRPPRPRQQGDALLPLPQQAGPLSGAAAPDLHPRRRAPGSHRRERRAAPPTRSIAHRRPGGFITRARVLPGHHAARGRRRRRPSRCRTPSPRSPRFRAPSAASSRRASPARSFRPVHPIAAYFSMLAPIVVYSAGAPIRKELSAQHLVDGAGADATTPSFSTSRTPCAARSRHESR